MATLRLEIVTPEGKAFSDEVDMVTLPGTEGELGVLPQHTPLMTEIAPGQLKVSQSGRETYLAVGEGFVEVLPNRVTVLTDLAVEDKNIDESAVQQALDRAEQAKKDPHLGSEGMEAAEASIQKSLAQLRVKRRRREGQ